MTRLRISPTRIKVYRLLVDGGEDRRPLCPSSIADVLHRGRSTVYDHVEALRLAGYVRPIRGTSNPALYERGANAALLDEILKARVSGVSGAVSGVPSDGGRDVQYCSPGNNNARIVQVPTGEAHVNGRFIFPVLREGDHTLKVRENGEWRTIPVFGKDPINLRSGVRYYKGRVTLGDGTTLKVHYYDQGHPALHVWPDPVATTAGTVETAPERLQERAAEAVAVLGRCGGWRFGEPAFIGETHYATNDQAILGNFPEGFRPADGSSWWMDKTPPPLAVETKDQKQAQAVLDFYGRTNSLAAGQKQLDQRIVELGHHAESLVSISEKLAVSIANIAAAEAEQIERAARGMADRMDAEVMSS